MLGALALAAATYSFNHLVSLGWLLIAIFLAPIAHDDTSLPFSRRQLRNLLRRFR